MIELDECSQLWTDAERRFMIGKLAAILREDMYRPSLTYLEKLDAIERICLLATADTSFLEDNRLRILGKL